MTSNTTTLMQQPYLPLPELIRPVSEDAKQKKRKQHRRRLPMPKQLSFDFGNETDGKAPNNEVL
jgi:hypothetical protein